MNDPKRTPLPPSDPFLNLGDFQEDLGMFEAATHAEPVEIFDITLNKILFAPDGSSQDPTARRLAELVAELTKTEVVEAAGLKTAAEMHAAKQQHGADLLVLPIPFGADIDELGEASLGQLADQILVDTLPILAVRQAMKEPDLRKCLQHVVVPLSPENRRVVEVLSWACRLLPESGQLTIVEIANAELRAEASHLREPSEPSGFTASERVSRVLTRHFAGSIAAIQKRSTELGFALQVFSTSGQFVESTLAHLEAAPGLVMVAGTGDRRSDSYHHETDLLLASQYPILIV